LLLLGLLHLWLLLPEGLQQGGLGRGGGGPGM